MALLTPTSGYVYDTQSGDTQRIELTAADDWDFVAGTRTNLGSAWEGMATIVPEPCRLALATLAGLGWVFLRRRRSARSLAHANSGVIWSPGPTRSNSWNAVIARSTSSPLGRKRRPTAALETKDSYRAVVGRVGRSSGSVTA